jgi:hypothetical protein
VIPEQVLKSQQALSILDALRNSPGVTSSQTSPTVYNNLSIRGIPVENRGNYRLNGSADRQPHRPAAENGAAEALGRLRAVAMGPRRRPAPTTSRRSGRPPIRVLAWRSTPTNTAGAGHACRLDLRQAWRGGNFAWQRRFRHRYHER